MPLALGQARLCGIAAPFPNQGKLEWTQSELLCAHRDDYRLHVTQGVDDEEKFVNEVIATEMGELVAAVASKRGLVSIGDLLQGSGVLLLSHLAGYTGVAALSGLVFRMSGVASDSESELAEV